MIWTMEATSRRADRWVRFYLGHYIWVSWSSSWTNPEEHTEVSPNKTWLSFFAERKLQPQVLCAKPMEWIAWLYLSRSHQLLSYHPLGKAIIKMTHINNVGQDTWKKWTSVGMWISTCTVENSGDVPFRTKNRTLWSSNLTTGYISPQM